VSQGSARPGLDPSFGTAGQAVRAILNRAISSSELVEHVFGRIERFDPILHAFVTLDEEGARTRARQADVALARGEPWGPLHGVPIMIKDGFATAGLRTTAGAKALASFVPDEDAVAVARLRRAGAVIIGKTNVPEFLADWQSYNDLAGTTHNPWDLTRTAGGSTGGGAAALAAGLGFLELGSDLRGSIRIPAHFCGVYGHKPTTGVVSTQGHIPPPPGTPPGPDLGLGVAGPLARGAEDLLLAMQVLGGPGPLEARAYQWRLPGPRKATLRAYRLGYVLDDPHCPLDAEVGQVLRQAVNALEREGVSLTEGWPPGFDFEAAADAYHRLFSLTLPGYLPEEELARFAFRDWYRLKSASLRLRALWQAYFDSFDAFLLPVNFVAAFPHDHSEPKTHRRLRTEAGMRRGEEQERFVSLASLIGCPATSAPVGLTQRGLPVGLQVLAPYLEDATSIAVAGHLGELLGHRSPAGF
jgi:amidase